jgi:hypothetical protein
MSTLTIALMIALIILVVAAIFAVNKITYLTWDTSPEAVEERELENLAEFNDKLLNGTLPEKSVYKNLYDTIQKSKTVDVDKIIPYQCIPITLIKGKSCKDYQIVEVFLDENKKFRLALEWRPIEKGNVTYKNKCLTLDEIEKKIPFTEIIEQYNKDEKVKEESRLELAKMRGNRILS